MVVTLIGVSLFVLLIFSGERGLAVVKQFTSLFAPEKVIVQEIEGEKERTEVQLNEGSHAEYVMYIDESRYTMKRGEDADVITTIEPLPDHYPEVSMEIRQIDSVSPDQYVLDMTEELKQEFPDLQGPEFVTEPVEGYQLHGISSGQDWDSPVIHVYIISNGKSGSFVITQRYFLEAAEGHGARFNEMLKEFQPVED